jgi:hypothetical protein
MYDKNDSKNMILYVLYVKNDKMIPLINLFTNVVEPLLIFTCFLSHFRVMSYFPLFVWVFKHIFFQIT